MANTICRDCGHDLSWHDSSGCCSPALGCGYAPCKYALDMLDNEDTSDETEYDFTNPDHNPWILSSLEIDKLINMQNR